MERAIIYCRVSSLEQVENLSLTTQERLCREYCQQNGMEVDKVFIEKGESAKTINRHEFNKMLDYCKKTKGKINYLVVYQLSRFARQSNDHHSIRALLLKYGIRLRSVTEPIDDSSTGRLMEGVLASFAQFDNDLRSDRTIVGMTEAAKAGKWVHQAPMGYLTGKAGQPSLIPDPERAEHVRNAFELIATGRYRKRQVIDKTNARGFKTKKGGELTTQTFSKMLRNPLYAGRIVLESFQVNTKGDFEPIISEELFRRVQDILDGNTGRSVPHYRNNCDFPLRRFTRCAKCGTPLTGSWSTGRKKKYPYYRCRNAKCRAVNIPRENLEELFIETINRIKPKPEYLALFREIVRDVYKERISEGSKEKSKLQANLGKLKRKKSRLIDLRLEEEIDQASFQEKKADLEADIRNMERELAVLDSGTMDIDSALDFAERIIMHADELWKSLEFDERIKLQNLLFSGGLEFDGEKFGTIKTDSIFSMLTENAVRNDTLATPAGIEPALPA